MQLCRTPSALAARPEFAHLIKCDSFASLPAVIFPLLKKLDFFIAHDALLFVKVLRVVTAFAKTVDGPERLTPELEQLIADCILPGISLVKCNSGTPVLRCCRISMSTAALAEEAWQLVKLLPYQTRYRLYNAWKVSAALHLDVQLNAAADQVVQPAL